MKTVTEMLADFAAGIKASAADLLLNHSRLKRDQPDRTLVILGGDHWWQPLADEGGRVRSKLRDDYSRFHAVLKTLLRTQPSGVLGKLRQANTSAMNVIDQQGITYISSVEEARRRFDAAIDEQVGLLSALHDGAEGEYVYVP